MFAEPGADRFPDQFTVAGGIEPRLVDERGPVCGGVFGDPAADRLPNHLKLAAGVVAPAVLMSAWRWYGRAD
jgi:hypothetical protein